MHKKAAMLEDRGVISVNGEDATIFLQGLLTNDVERLHPSEARYGALLTPQGKILFDMIVARAAGGEKPSYLIDCTATQAADLAGAAIGLSQRVFGRLTGALRGFPALGEHRDQRLEEHELQVKMNYDQQQKRGDCFQQNPTQRL